MHREQAEKLVRDFLEPRLVNVMDGRKLFPLVARLERSESIGVSKLVEAIYRMHFPKGKRAGVRGKHAVRDHYLALAVFHLREAGYRPLTGRANPETACALVAHVATKLTRRSVTVATVENAWNATKGYR